MKNTVDLHYSIDEVLAAARYLHEYNNAPRVKNKSVQQWYEEILRMMERAVINYDLYISTGGCTIIFETEEGDNFCHASISVDPVLMNSSSDEDEVYQTQIIERR